MTTRVFTSFWLIVGEVSLPGWLPSGNGHLYGGSGEAKNFMFDLWNDNLVLKGGSELEITQQIVPKSWWQRYFQGTHLVSFCLPSHGVRTIQTRSGSPHLDLQKKSVQVWAIGHSRATQLVCSSISCVTPPLLWGFGGGATSLNKSPSPDIIPWQFWIKLDDSWRFLGCYGCNELNPRTTGQWWDDCGILQGYIWNNYDKTIQNHSPTGAYCWVNGHRCTAMGWFHRVKPWPFWPRLLKSIQLRFVSFTPPGGEVISQLIIVDHLIYMYICVYIHIHTIYI